MLKEARVSNIPDPLAVTIVAPLDVCERLQLALEKADPRLALVRSVGGLASRDGSLWSFTWAYGHITAPTSTPKPRGRPRKNRGI